MDANTRTPSTFFSSSTVVGRLYGQMTNDECLFDVAQDDDGRAVIGVRFRAPVRPEIRLPFNTAMLVQIFEAPNVLWLARATLLGDDSKPMITYSPVVPLESLDGRSMPPVLAEVTPEQEIEGISDACP